MWEKLKDTNVKREDYEILQSNFVDPKHPQQSSLRWIHPDSMTTLKALRFSENIHLELQRKVQIVKLELSNSTMTTITIDRTKPVREHIMHIRKEALEHGFEDFYLYYNDKKLVSNQNLEAQGIKGSEPSLILSVWKRYLLHQPRVDSSNEAKSDSKFEELRSQVLKQRIHLSKVDALKSGLWMMIALYGKFVTHQKQPLSNRLEPNSMDVLPPHWFDLWPELLNNWKQLKTDMTPKQAKWTYVQFILSRITYGTEWHSVQMVQSKKSEMKDPEMKKLFGQKLSFGMSKNCVFVMDTNKNVILQYPLYMILSIKFDESKKYFKLIFSGDSYGYKRIKFQIIEDERQLFNFCTSYTLRWAANMCFGKLLSDIRKFSNQLLSDLAQLSPLELIIEHVKNLSRSIVSLSLDLQFYVEKLKKENEDLKVQDITQPFFESLVPILTKVPDAHEKALNDPDKQQGSTMQNALISKLRPLINDYYKSARQLIEMMPLDQQSPSQKPQVGLKANNNNNNVKSEENNKGTMKKRAQTLRDKSEKVNSNETQNVHPNRGRAHHVKVCDLISATPSYSKLMKDIYKDYDPKDPMQFFRDRFCKENPEFEVKGVVLTHRTLGSGANGTVVLAEHDKKLVAAKRLQDGNDIGQFVTEVHAQQKFLNCSNVVQILGVALLNGNVHVIMEFCELGDLRSWLLNQEHSFSELIDVSNQLANIVQELQNKKIVHRDLAARNVLLVRVNGKIILKISDFGLSVASEEEKKLIVSKSAINEQRLAWKWSSPEAICNLPFDFSTDRYSFGVTLLEIWNRGFHPWLGIDTRDFGIYVHVKKRPPELARPENCPKEIFELICKLIFNDPHSRPPMDEVSKTLAEIEKKYAGVEIDMNSNNNAEDTNATSFNNEEQYMRSPISENEEEVYYKTNINPKSEKSSAEIVERIDRARSKTESYQYHVSASALTTSRRVPPPNISQNEQMEPNPNSVVSQTTPVISNVDTVTVVSKPEEPAVQIITPIQIEPTQPVPPTLILSNQEETATNTTINPSPGPTMESQSNLMNESKETIPTSKNGTLRKNGPIPPTRPHSSLMSPQTNNNTNAISTPQQAETERNRARERGDTASNVSSSSSNLMSESNEVIPTPKKATLKKQPPIAPTRPHSTLMSQTPTQTNNHVNTVPKNETKIEPKIESKETIPTLKTNGTLRNNGPIPPTRPHSSLIPPQTNINNNNNTITSPIIEQQIQQEPARERGDTASNVSSSSSNLMSESNEAIPTPKKATLKKQLPIPPKPIIQTENTQTNNNNNEDSALRNRTTTATTSSSSSTNLKSESNESIPTPQIQPGTLKKVKGPTPVAPPRTITPIMSEQTQTQTQTQIQQTQTETQPQIQQTQTQEQTQIETQTNDVAVVESTQSQPTPQMSSRIRNQTATTATGSIIQTPVPPPRKSTTLTPNPNPTQTQTDVNVQQPNQE